jgi:hypothetical protein
MHVALAGAQLCLPPGGSAPRRAAARHGGVGLACLRCSEYPAVVAHAPRFSLASALVFSGAVVAFTLAGIRVCREAAQDRSAAEQSRTRRRELEQTRLAEEEVAKNGEQNAAGVQLKAALAEVRAFNDWIRSTRPKVADGKGAGVLTGVECLPATFKGRRAGTCAGGVVPERRSDGVLYAVVWYVDAPSVMSMTATGIPYSWALDCHALGAQEKRRREEEPAVVSLHCALPDEKASYGIFHTGKPATTTVSWFSPGYLERDPSARAEIAGEQ